MCRNALLFVKGMRKDILDPKRVQDIFLDHGEDSYKVVFRGGVWTFTHLGKKKDVKVVGVDNDGMLFKVHRICIACSANGKAECSGHD